jgi:hypothetical protein
MRAPILFASILLLSGGYALAQDIIGEWHGAVEVANDAPLRLALHISHGGTATLDSVDEGGTGLPVDSIHLNGFMLHFEMKSIGGVYDGKIAPDGSKITGEWRQDGGIWPLDWEWGKDPADITGPSDPERAEQNGRLCVGLLYDGNLSGLWSRLSPVMRQQLKTEAGLREFRDRLLRGVGSEIAVSSESVQAAGALQVYCRLARFTKSQGNTEVRFEFNNRGAITEISVQPALR